MVITPLWRGSGRARHDRRHKRDRRLVQRPRTWGVILAVAAVIVFAGIWALGSIRSTPSIMSRGKWGVLVAIVATMLLGGSKVYLQILSTNGLPDSAPTPPPIKSQTPTQDRPLPSRRPLRRLGRRDNSHPRCGWPWTGHSGSAAEKAVKVLDQQREILDHALSAAGLPAAGWLTPGELAYEVRCAYDPAARTALDYTPTAGRDLASAGPLAVQEHWDYLRTDTGYHSVLWIREWPSAADRITAISSG